jgi:glycerophosphoryl diester phosphodiesterase
VREHRPLSISGPPLVAHRGHAHRFPENTLPALRDAAARGVSLLEFDIQLSRDGVPVLLHDATLARTAGDPRDARRLPLAALRAVSVHEPARFGDAFLGTPIPTVAEVVAWAAADRGLHLFPEIKVESFETHGRDAVVAAVLADLAPLAGRCTVLSFDVAALRQARAAGHRVGWCPPDASRHARAEAQALAPEFLFGDVADFLGSDDAPLWPGPWDWALYEVADAATARRGLACGARVLETMRVAELLEALA